MRVTGGKYTNRKVHCPKGTIRPAMDRMRESVFAILGDLSGTSFLDLFSGSGIIALEAASRGAGPVVLVEGDHKKRRVITANIEFTDEKIELHMMRVEKFIALSSETFDTIFLDPPFAYPKKREIIQKISEKGLLADTGRLLIHYPMEDELPGRIGSFRQYRNNKYGRSLVGFYRYEDGY